MLLLLCIMLDSDPDRRGRTSVCRRIMPFLDQRINAKFAKSMFASACLPTGDWAKTPSVTQSPYSGRNSLGPGTALVW